MSPWTRWTRWTARVPTLCALALASSLVPTGAVRADAFAFTGEYAIRFSLNGTVDEVAAQGTGVATVDAPSGPLQTLELDAPFATISASQTATSGAGVDEVHFDGVRVDPLAPGPDGSPGVFAPIHDALQSAGALTRRTLPAAGSIRLCNLVGCPASLVLDLDQTIAGEAAGPGVGGSLTAGGAGMTRITVTGAPWTIGTTTVSYRTVNGGTGFLTGMGFARGPLSGTSTTLQPGGMVQLVTGTQTQCFGCEGQNDLGGQITRLTLTFTPEPALFLLLGAGALGVGLLGRRRLGR